MKKNQQPTERELEILKILWDKGEASVREIYEEMSQDASIVQNTIQAFLRLMESKGLVKHRLEGRAFIYKPRIKRGKANEQMMLRVLNRVFDGAIDQLVQSAISAQNPTKAELDKLEELIKQARKNRK